MAASARVDGEEKVLATAQHIVKSLATSKNTADDMIRILSGFDHRLSAIPDLFPPNTDDDGTDPGDDATDPGDDASDPGDDASDPGDDAIDPGGDAIDPGGDATDARDGAPAGLDGAPAGRDGAPAGRDGPLDARDRDRALASRDGPLDARDSALASRDGAIAASDGTIAARDDSIAVGDVSVAVRDLSIAVRDETIAVRDVAIAVRDESIPVRDESIPVCDDSSPVAVYDPHEEQGEEADDTLAAAERVVHRWDTSATDALLWDSPCDVAEFLSAVDEIAFLAENPDADPGLRSRADCALQIAMARLEDEFRQLMLSSPGPIDAAAGLRGPACRLSFSSTVDDFESSMGDEQQRQHQDEPGAYETPAGSPSAADPIPPEAVADLMEISLRMIKSGYGQELCQVYSSVRRDLLLESLTDLGVEKMSIEEVQRVEWESLDDKMKKWIHAVKVAVRVLLAGERRLCDQIFATSPELREEGFAEAAKGCIMQLLNFGDAIAIGQRSSEKLFRILGMYEALVDVLPDLEALFSGDAKDFVCGEAKAIIERLGDAVKGTFAEFGNAVQRETSRKPLQGGEIHPLTRYVMNYIRLLVDYSNSLNQLFDKEGVDTQNNLEGAENMTPLGRRVFVLISHLESNLEEKSKLYEDGGMQYIFLMNNILYIVQKVKDSELKTLLGDHWVRKRRGQIKQHATSYLRASWTKALSYLSNDGLGGSGGSHSVSRDALKDRFKGFNLAFEEIYRTQTAWKVPDPQLREELRISISEKVFPAYRSFLGRFRGQLESGRHSGKYIKYTPEDLENHLSDLFEGLAASSNHPRRKISS